MRGLVCKSCGKVFSRKGGGICCSRTCAANERKGSKNVSWKGGKQNEYYLSIIDACIKENQEGASLTSLARKYKCNRNWLGDLFRERGITINRVTENFKQFHFTHQMFLDKVLVNTVTGCWEWQGNTDKNGYGHINLPNLFLAHRYSYSYYKGEITMPCVCHTCDNRGCVNPDHLFLGTQKDNILDMHKKGRFVGNRKQLVTH